MTTFALIAGMMPVAIGLGEGGEFYRPMAVAIIGGTITSTLLTLLVVPTFYDSIEIARERAIAKFHGRAQRWNPRCRVRADVRRGDPHHPAAAAHLPLGEETDFKVAIRSDGRTRKDRAGPDKDLGFPAASRSGQFLGGLKDALIPGADRLALRLRRDVLPGLLAQLVRFGRIADLIAAEGDAVELARSPGHRRIVDDAAGLQPFDDATLLEVPGAGRVAEDRDLTDFERIQSRPSLSFQCPSDMILPCGGIFQGNRWKSVSRCRARRHSAATSVAAGNSPVSSRAIRRFATG